MGEIISILGLLRDTPAFLTASIVLLTVGLTLWLRMRDADVQSSTSVSKAQNERLLALMGQNEKLLNSVEKLHGQVQELNDKMTSDAEEYRSKLDNTHRVIDEMRRRIMELEDLVREYQHNSNNCILVGCPNRKR